MPHFDTFSFRAKNDDFDEIFIQGKSAKFRLFDDNSQLKMLVTPNATTCDQKVGYFWNP